MIFKNDAGDGAVGGGGRKTLQQKTRQEGRGGLGRRRVPIPLVHLLNSF